METKTQPIIVSSGSGGWVMPVVGLVTAGVLYWKFGKPYFDAQEQKKHAKIRNAMQAL
jgi:hypothetical protein